MSDFHTLPDPELSRVVEICRLLGSPNESNCAYQLLFFQRLKETGMDIEAMNVQELLEIIRKTKIEFNRRADALMAGRMPTDKHCTQCGTYHKNAIALCNTCDDKLRTEQRGMW